MQWDESGNQPSVSPDRLIEVRRLRSKGGAHLTHISCCAVVAVPWNEKYWDTLLLILSMNLGSVQFLYHLNTWDIPWTTLHAMIQVSPTSAASGMNRLNRELRNNARPTIFFMGYIPEKYPTGIWMTNVPYKMALRMIPWISGLQS